MAREEPKNPILERKVLDSEHSVCGCHSDVTAGHASSADDAIATAGTSSPVLFEEVVHTAREEPKNPSQVRKVATVGQASVVDAFATAGQASPVLFEVEDGDKDLATYRKAFIDHDEEIASSDACCSHNKISFSAVISAQVAKAEKAGSSAAISGPLYEGMPTSAIRLDNNCCTHEQLAQSLALFRRFMPQEEIKAMVSLIFLVD
mmetsp:Transcript_134012/g.257897  ORF Transcript_134012/g.257897 Transcript_134012/m.257897 type:complete len:205 (-) Transcript_134012:83-697(-)